MKKRLQPFSIYGLYFSITCGLLGIIIWFVKGEFVLAAQIMFALFVLSAAFSLLVNPSRFIAVITGRKAKYGSNSLIMILAMLGILVVIYYIVYSNPVRWDFTASEDYTLSTETTRILNSLPEPVTATAFYTDNNSTGSIEVLLQSFQYSSNGKFTYRFVNPDEEPLLAREKNVYQDGLIVLEMGDQSEMISSVTESDLDSALNRLMFPGVRTLYFITGHGEADLSGNSDNSYSYLNHILEIKNYTVKPLNLSSETAIPDDANAVIIAGPTENYSESEIAQIKAYADGGGSLLVMLEPSPLTGISYSEDTIGNYLLENWGIGITDDMLYDPNVRLAWGISSDPATYSRTAITSSLSNKYVVLYTARQVVFPKILENLNQTILMQTSSEAWGEINPTASGETTLQKDSTDISGPISMGVAAENSQTGSRIVVIGDSEFANDNLLESYNNSDLIVNSIDWVAQQEGMISLTPRDAVDRFMINPTPEAMNLIFLVAVILLPSITAIAGIVTWLVRRRKI